MHYKQAPDLFPKPLLPGNGLGQAPDHLLGLSHLQHGCRLPLALRDWLWLWWVGAPSNSSALWATDQRESCFPQLHGGCGLAGLCRGSLDSPVESLLPTPPPDPAPPPLLPTVVPGNAGWWLPCPGVSPARPGCGKGAHGQPCSPFMSGRWTAVAGARDRSTQNL